MTPPRRNTPSPRMSALLVGLGLAVAAGSGAAASREGARGKSDPAATEQQIEPLGPQGAAASLFPRPARPVADIVSPTWGDAQERDLAGETRQLTDKLALKSGEILADIGAGAGYDTLRLSRVVGPKGRVIAEDVRPEYLTVLMRSVRSEKLANVVPALGQTDDPRLKPASVDVAVLIHMYHEIAAPYAFLYNLAPAMKPGGRVGVMDLARGTAQHGTPPSLLRCEFEAVGYRQVGSSQMDGGLGYLAVFAAPKHGERPRPQDIRPCPPERSS